MKKPKTKVTKPKTVKVIKVPTEKYIVPVNENFAKAEVKETFVETKFNEIVSVTKNSEAYEKKYLQTSSQGRRGRRR